MKRNIFTVFLILSGLSLFAEGSANLKKFIRGNLSDKVNAVKNAGEEDIADLSLKAIDFVNNYKEVLGDDRDLDTLAVAGVLSLPQNYVDSISSEEKLKLSISLYNLYSKSFNENVKIAVLNKISSGNIPYELFIDELNETLSKGQLITSSPNYVKAVILSLSTIGSGRTFTTLYNCYNDTSLNQYKPQIEAALAKLSEKSFSDIISIIRKGNIQDMQKIFNLIVKNEKISKNIRSQIAENILSSTIYIVEGMSSVVQEIILLQTESLKVLAECEWTRSSGTVISFFNQAMKEYENGVMKQNDFVTVIGCTAITAPMDCVQIYSSYLLSMNKNKENGLDVSEDVALAIINALGAIGDKNAFDSLLSVTYYNYSDNVITQARNALASLKW